MVLKRFRSRVKKIFKKKEPTEKQVLVTPVTITGGRETGGIVTGGKTDVITPSRPVSRGGGGGRVSPTPTPKPIPSKVPVKIPTRVPLISGRPISTVEAVRREKGIRGVLQRTQERRRILQTKQRREERKGITFQSLKRRKDIAKFRLREKALELLLIPASLISLAKNPKQLKEIPKSIAEAPKKFGKALRVDPTTAFISIGADIFLAKGIGDSLSLVGKVGSRATTRLSPKFVKIKKRSINIPSGQSGKEINIKIGGTVKKLAEPLKEQVRLAGKKVTAVSAQADRIINMIRKKRIVRKPIPNEDILTQRTKFLLKKFDERKIGRKDLIDLDSRIKRETKGAGSLLERSFFADPKGRLRPSRLGRKQKEASLLDLLTGEVTFKTQKPQVLVFQDIRVQKFPKALSKIQQKLKTGKTLTESEGKKLLDFQLKKSGKFKPIGALTKEPEITLAPGEIIKRQKTLAVTIINGRRVPIIKAIVVKAKSETRKLLKKAKEGTLKFKELKKLRRNLGKETGFKTSFSRGRIGKPRARLPIPRPRPRIKPRLRPIKPRPRPRIKPRLRPIKPRLRPRIKPRLRPRPTARPIKIKQKPRKVRKVRTVPRRGFVRRGIKPPLKPIIPVKLKKKIRIKIPKAKQGFQVFARPIKKRKGQKRSKLIKISKVPIKKSRAEDLRNFVVDRSLSRTGKIKPTRLKAKKPLLKVPRGFAKRTKKKFRSFRISKGKKVPLRKGRVIERGKKGSNFLLDTRSERRGITLRRKLSQLEKTSGFKKLKGKQTPKTRITPTKRQVMLKNLEKAREVRMSNLKKKKK